MSDSESHSDSSFNSGDMDQFDYQIKDYDEDEMIKDKLKSKGLG